MKMTEKTMRQIMMKQMTMRQMTVMVLFATLLCTPHRVTAQGSCVEGDNLQNAGGSCNFGTVTWTLCDWVNMEANNLTWKSYYNDVNRSPCVLTDTSDLNMNQIVRLKSPLLCATNSSFFSYSLQFSYSMFHTDRCRFSLSVSSDKLYEMWNTQHTTFDPRSNGWKTTSVNISNPDTPFFLIFAAEKIHATDTTNLALDSLSYTSQIIATTTTTTTATTTPVTTNFTASATTTTATTPSTSPTTTSPTTTVTTTTTTFMPTSVSSSTETTTPVDDGLIWGLSKDIVIAIGVALGVVIILVIVIAIICRRVRSQEDVKTVSFALNSPTAYNVNEKSPGQKRREMKARTSALVPSKHGNWQPDHSLF